MSLKITSNSISVGTYKVNATYTKEMMDDLSKQYGLDSTIEEVLKRQEIYKRRKQIVDKLLKDM